MISRNGQPISYDAENHLTAFAGKTYLYDGDGKRVAEINADGTATIFIGNYFEGAYPEPPPQPLKFYMPFVSNAEEGTDLFEPITARMGTLYFYADGQRIAMKKDGVVSCIYGDQLGSVSAVADGNGNLISETLYHPWGTTRYAQGTSPTDYGYTGQMKEGDIYFYNARWYDPQLGRFMQADTIVPLEVQGIQAFDRYAYVNNNPMRYIDPAGNKLIELGNLQENPPLPEDLINEYFLPKLIENAKRYRNVRASVPAEIWNNPFTRPIQSQLYHEIKFILDSLPKIGSLDMKPELTDLYFEGFRNDNDKFSIEGEYKVFYDTWGNMQYGFIAAKLGWSLDYALEGAGKAQYFHDLLRRGIDPRIQNENGTGFARYDDPADQAGIIAGFRLFQTCGMTCLATDVYSIIENTEGINKEPLP